MNFKRATEEDPGEALERGKKQKREETKRKYKRKVGRKEGKARRRETSEFV